MKKPTCQDLQAKIKVLRQQLQKLRKESEMLAAKCEENAAIKKRVAELEAALQFAAAASQTPRNLGGEQWGHPSSSAEGRQWSPQRSE